MKNFFTLILTLTFTITFAQQGEWTWMRGSSLTNSYGTYGTQGVVDTLNEPPASYGPARWIDHDGNFWLFGGVTPLFLMSDLWKYDVSANKWTWMKGPGIANQPGYYGVQGVPSPNNNPGARAYGAATWTDNDGNLWLFGGNGYGGSIFSSGMLADLWRYDIGTNEWTWISGNPDDSPHFGTLQVPDSSNTPGEREECTANWVDTSNGLWFYGGLNNGVGWSDGNDSWRFDISTNQWAWMSGDTTYIQPPVYGTQNVFDPDNTPGGRMNYTGWQDSNGFFWLFGGQNDMSSADYADLWKFDPTIYQWAWISGSNQTNNNGSSGNKCDTSASFYPKSRWENRARWIDACNNLWLFGGEHQSNAVNDLWIYNPQLSVWSLVSGSTSYNQLGVYGTKGVPDPANVPGARMGAVSFMDNSGNLWLFGGSKDNSIGIFFNDLWRYVPDPNCPASIACAPVVPPNFMASDTTVCEKFCIDFYDSSQNNPVSWLWNFPGGNPSSSTEQNPTNVCYDDPGVYDVSLKTTNASGAVDSVTFENYITVYSNPFAPTITQSGNILTSSNGLTYQWLLNGNSIPGATDQSYEITESGLYTVIITNENGCAAQSSIDATFIGIDEVHGNFSVNIYPNPSNGNFVMEVMNGGSPENISIKVTNSLSQIIFYSDEKISSNNWKRNIDLKNIAAGVYLIELTSNYFDNPARKKIIITK